MGKATLQLLATIPDKPIYTKGGNLHIGKFPTSQSGVIGAASYTGTKTLLAVITLQKHVIVSEIKQDALIQLARHEFPKRLTNVLFPPPGDYAIISDAFGDVYRLPIKGCLNLREEQVQEQYRLLGHFSTITDICLRDGVIASADRDNKIRISRYPQSYVIQAFCLAHTEFVSCLVWWGDKLVSGGGDGCIRLWNGGNEICVANVGSLIDGDEATVAKILVSPFHAETLLFVLVDCSIVFEIPFVDGKFGQVEEVRRFDSVITGIEVDDGVLWVSTGERMYRICDRECVTIDVGVSEDDVGGEGNEEELRFSWLSKQRKKEMVENWKGKKRRYGEFIKS